MKKKESTHSKDPIYGASSSSTSPHVDDHDGGTRQPKGNDYEVFLSFRGIDTRKGFTDYLYTSLVDAGINVFRDDNELRVGEEIGPELLCCITQSKISIPIISEEYASSKWCLRELAQMLKCKRSKRHIVLPIFYKVKPSQVGHLTGRLRDAINAHKENFDEMIVKEWEEALKEVSSLKGWESEKIDNGHEGALVKIVVKKVISELKRPFQLIVSKELVGIDDRVEEIMSLIDAKFDDTKIIGIYGMGGIGKTTLARVLYNNLSSHFEHLSFVADIRETSLRKGIEFMQKKLIYDITRSSCDVSNVDEGIGVIKSQFTSKKVLVLLDDMDDNIQLNALVGDGSWLKAGSVVIITTRNKSILDEARAGHMYQLNELSLDQSLILFCRHAFRKDSPHKDYEVISRDVVSTTAGLPLALEVIGSFLRGKTEEVWKDTFNKLKKVPDKKVQEKLRLSYEALDFEEQQIFLDIACFFIGSSKQIMTYMWDACGFFPGKGFDVLSLMSLIKIDKDGKLMMHDQLRDLGREIVRLENQKKPQKRSRLWISEEAVDVLDNNKCTSKIEALRTGKYGRRKSYTSEQFKELTNLRFLQVSGVNFTGDFQNLLPQLRWLQWEDCPKQVTATNFHPKKLVGLNLSWSEISEDWGGWGLLKMATELKVLNLSHCHSLRRTPDLSAFENLEILILEDCRNLEEIHPSIENIKTLVSLNVRSCWSLDHLPAGVGRMEELRELLLDHTAIQEIPTSRGCLMKLENLCASFCGELAQLPESIESLVSLTQLDLSHLYIGKLPESMGSLVSLTQLNLSYSWIAKLPESIGSLVSLTQLDLSYSGIEELPQSMGSLVSLTRLDLSHSCIAKLPESMGSLVSLTQLNLSHSGIEELPRSMGSLVTLTQLDLSHSKIKELPEFIGSLKELKTLDASYCKSLACIPSSIGHLASLQRLLLRECYLLREIPYLIGKLVSLTELDLEYTTIVELPESIGNLQKLGILHISGTHITELPGAIGMLAKLQELSASCCKNLEELPSNISELISLNKLDLDQSGISGLPESISKLSFLQYLNVQYCEKLRELPELPSGLTGLRVTCQSLSLPHLSQLTLLKKLALFHCRWIECLPELPVGLSMLSITCCRELEVLTNLSNLKHLSELILDDCFELTEVTGLEGLQSLSNLHVRQCPKISRLDGVEFLESLRGLLIDGAFPGSLELTSPKVSRPEGSLDLSNSKILQETNAASCLNLVKTLGFCGSKSSQMLDISACTSAGQSLDLSSSKYLRKLVVTNCKNLTEIRGLDGLEYLEVLDISGCTYLRQLPDLSNLKNLEDFNAANCKNLVEIRCLDVSSLKHFCISGCTSLRQSPVGRFSSALQKFKALIDRYCKKITRPFQ